MRRRFLLFLTVCLASPATGQTSQITRTQAIALALASEARLGLARADSLVARAELTTARTFPNPSLSLSYSKAVPTRHLMLDIPLEFPGLRSLRVRAAQLGLQAASLRYQLARALLALDADTVYTHSAAAAEHLRLSIRNSSDADSLLHMAERRFAAGDASEMDVELARIAAGQQHAVLATDSLTLASSILDLQTALGIVTDSVILQPIDSLGLPPEFVRPGQTLNERAAALTLESATAAARLQHRSIWSQPSVTVGFDQGDPDQTGILPVFGIGIGLPLFDRNRAAIAQAEAERVRAQAALTLAQVEARAEITRMARERQIAFTRIERDQDLIRSADRVAAMSLTAYREGAVSLPTVLEAQRNARDVLAQYIDDLTAAWIATAELRALAVQPADASRRP
jgi:cobalt-zinc-cadmium efflux system outer membrane protein